MPQRYWYLTCKRRFIRARILQTRLGVLVTKWGEVIQGYTWVQGMVSWILRAWAQGPEVFMALSWAGRQCIDWITETTFCNKFTKMLTKHSVLILNSDHDIFSDTRFRQIIIQTLTHYTQLLLLLLPYEYSLAIMWFHW